MFVLNEFPLQLSPVSVVLRALSSRADDDEHCREDVEEKRSEELHEENQRVGELNERRITNDTPGALFAFVVVEMQMREMRNEDEKIDEKQKKNHPLGQTLTRLLSKGDPLKDCPRTFDRHTSVEPMIEIDQDLQRRFDEETIQGENPSLTEKKKDELQGEDNHREQRSDRRREKIHSTARVLTDRMAERQDRTDATDRSNQTHQHGDQQTDLHG